MTDKRPPLALFLPIDVTVSLPDDAYELLGIVLGRPATIADIRTIVSRSGQAGLDSVLAQAARIRRAGNHKKQNHAMYGNPSFYDSGYDPAQPST